MSITPQADLGSAGAANASVRREETPRQIDFDRPDGHCGEVLALSRDKILRRLHRRRGELLDELDLGEERVARLELEEVQREIDRLELLEHAGQQPTGETAALRGIVGELLAIQAKLERGA